MILKLLLALSPLSPPLLAPSLLLIAGLVLSAFAVLVPPAHEHDGPRQPLPPSERVRRLERIATTRGGKTAVRRALDDPDPQVAAVAAILLRDLHS